MPRVAPGKLPPATVEAFAGLTRHGLRVLTAAQILPPPSELTPSDAVVARLSRSIYWHGPGLTAPGRDNTKPQRQVATARAAEELRLQLRKRASMPESLAVTMSTGATRPIDDGFAAGRTYQDLMEESPEPWMCIPLRAWWEEARNLPTGPGGDAYR